MDSVSNLILSLALIIIMWGMGMSLTVKDFKRVVQYPRAVVIGLINQLILLPVLGFSLIAVFQVPAELAIGLMILAACPGGPTSNLIVHLAKGDTALSVSLTAIASIITVFTIPLIINFSMQQILDQTAMIQLDVVDTIKKMCIVIIIPVSLGMLVRRYLPKFAEKMGKPVRIASAVLLFVIIIGIIVKEKEVLPGYFVQVGIVTLMLNVLSMVIGFFSARLLKLSDDQSISISVESGIQNGTLALAIAVGLLENPTFAIAPAVYSILMFFTGGAIIFYATRRKKGNLVE